MKLVLFFFRPIYLHEVYFIAISNVACEPRTRVTTGITYKQVFVVRRVLTEQN